MEWAACHGYCERIIIYTMALDSFKENVTECSAKHVPLTLPWGKCARTDPGDESGGCAGRRGHGDSFARRRAPRIRTTTRSLRELLFSPEVGHLIGPRGPVGTPEGQCMHAAENRHAQ